MGTTSRLDELTARAQRIIKGAASPGVQRAKPRDNNDSPSPAERERGPRDEGLPLILGIDPGTATMGYGLVRPLADGTGAYHALAYGVLETPAGAPMHLRLRTLYEGLSALITIHHPTTAAVEKLFFGRNTTTALTVGQARGIALLAIAQAGLDVAEYTPAEVKFALSSYGRATKNDIQRMTQMLLRLQAIPKPDDAADALAIALCHAHSLRAHALGLR